MQKEKRKDNTQTYPSNNLQTTENKQGKTNNYSQANNHKTQGELAQLREKKTKTKQGEHPQKNKLT